MYRKVSIGLPPVLKMRVTTEILTNFPVKMTFILDCQFLKFKEEERAGKGKGWSWKPKGK